MDRLELDWVALSDYQRTITLRQLVQYVLKRVDYDGLHPEVKDFLQSKYGENYKLVHTETKEMRLGYKICMHIISNDLTLLRGSREKIEHFTLLYETTHYNLNMNIALFVEIANEIVLYTDEVRALLLPKKTEQPQQEKNEKAEHARQWRELAESLQGIEARDALCAAFKWECLTHIEVYDRFSPGKVVEKESKISFISKCLGRAKTLAKKHGLKLPQDGGK